MWHRYSLAMPRHQPSCHAKRGLIAAVARRHQWPERPSFARVAASSIQETFVPRSAQLKVFRMPVGFHDAYIAAPSQKAAIEAWGSSNDVFARGEAERVTDPDLMAEPLAKPGVVIKKLRGTAEEQLAALPPNKARKRKPSEEKKKAPAKAAPRSKPKPRPSRTTLDKAEQAIESAKAKHRAKMEQIREKEAALTRERAKLERAQASELARLDERRDRAAESYEDALEAWR